MIDAQPGIAGEGVPEILPKGVDALAGIEVTQRIFPSQLYELRIRFAHFRPEQRVVTPALRCIDVQVGRHDVVIARHDEGRIRGDQRLAILVKPLEPSELEIEFRSRRGIAVR